MRTRPPLFAVSLAVAVAVLALSGAGCFQCVCVGPLFPPCGDGLCEEDEFCDCPPGKDCSGCCKADCPLAGGYCGDGACDTAYSEDYFSCPADCLPPCGDGWCDPGEDYISCPSDCDTPECVCGNFLCEPSCMEFCDQCSDCGPCATAGSRRSLLMDPAGISAFWLEFNVDMTGAAYWEAAGCWGRSVEPAGTGDVTYTVTLANDDDAVETTLPFPFPFYGVAESSAFVSANGFVTFDAPDTSGAVTLAAHDSMRRISPLMSDLAGGTITVDEFFDHLNVHWLGWGGMDIHLTLHANGTILFLWQGTSMSGPVILGISDGSGVGQDLQVLWPLC